MTLDEVKSGEEFVQFLLANPELDNIRILYRAFPMHFSNASIDIWVRNNIEWLSGFIHGIVQHDDTSIDFWICNWMWVASKGDAHYDAIYRLAWLKDNLNK